MTQKSKLRVCNNKIDYEEMRNQLLMIRNELKTRFVIEDGRAKLVPNKSQITQVELFIAFFDKYAIQHISTNVCNGDGNPEPFVAVNADTGEAYTINRCANCKHCAFGDTPGTAICTIDGIENLQKVKLKHTCERWEASE